MLHYVVERSGWIGLTVLELIGTMVISEVGVPQYSLRARGSHCYSGVSQEVFQMKVLLQ